MPRLPNGSDAPLPLSLVVAITGASGAIYPLRLVQVLLRAGLEVHLVASDAAALVLTRELHCGFPAADTDAAGWLRFIDTVLTSGPLSAWGFAEKLIHEDHAVPAAASLRRFATHDYSAGIASGSFLTRGMVICPCSMGTLSSIATGASSNLIQRAADVHLKERRPLILMPRETPLGSIALENMRTLSIAGATILPCMPGYYRAPQTLSDLVDFIVARICDQLRIPHALSGRWGGS